MRTFVLSSCVVDSYVEDFKEKLLALQSEQKMPLVWCPVGRSGLSILQKLSKSEEFDNSITVCKIRLDRNTSEVIVNENEKDTLEIIKNKNILIIDNTVHTGNTFVKVISKLQTYSPESISSYSVVVRKNSIVIPNHFGCMVEDHDRVHILVNPHADPAKDNLPNNELLPEGIFRKLLETDTTRPMIHSEEKFISKASWSDHWYNIVTDSCRKTYIYEKKGDIRGYITFKLQPGEWLLIDEVAVDKDWEGQGIGSTLIRWAETFAKNCQCFESRLWSIHTKVTLYEDLGYKKINGKSLLLDGKQFILMNKGILQPHYPILQSEQLPHSELSLEKVN